MDNLFGNLTLDNLEDVAQKIYQKLKGQKYAFSSVNMMGNENNPGKLISRPELRTSQELNGEPSVYFDKEHTPPEYGGFHFSDTYGVWGLSTLIPKDGRDFKPYEIPYIVIEYNKIQIIHRAPAGHVLYWTIVVQ